MPPFSRDTRVILHNVLYYPYRNRVSSSVQTEEISKKKKNLLYAYSTGDGEYIVKITIMQMKCYIFI